jgi:cell division protein FtsI (penicillin-binding protein 3)
VIARRIGLLFGLFFCLLSIAGARTAYFATVKGGSLKHAATTQQVVNQTVPAPRGTIVDREGVELAVSEAADNVFATPYQVKDPEAAARKLAPLLKKRVDALAQTIITAEGKHMGFVYLARGVPAARAQKLDDLKIAGIGLEPTMNRTYPRDWLASQALGSVNAEGAGNAGLEYRFDDALRGSDGKRRIVKDALGQPLSIDDSKPAEAGKKLQLSLDAAIQARTEQVLGEVGQTYKPKGATAIVMDPTTGELLAVANWPRIDANAPSQAPDYARENRAVGYTYEPGSTFKAVTIAGALSEKVVTPQTMFDLPPTIQVADRVIHESHRTAPISLSTKNILAESSNVGAIKIGLLEGPDNFAKWVSRFGFGATTGVDLPGEERGIVIPRSQYSGSSMGNLPIGQGISVTPMQMARAYAAIANGGRLVTPHIVQRISGSSVKEPPARRAISPRTALQLRTMLEGVFAPDGTAAEVTIPGYQLAGKTGTANKVDPMTHEYTDKYIASFVGFAPALHPKLLVSVMVDEPQTSIYGGVVAAPAFGDIMSFALQYLKIPPK